MNVGYWLLCCVHTVMYNTTIYMNVVFCCALVKQPTVQVFIVLCSFTLWRSVRSNRLWVCGCLVYIYKGGSWRTGEQIADSEHLEIVLPVLEIVWPHRALSSVINPGTCQCSQQQLSYLNYESLAMSGDIRLPYLHQCCSQCPEGLLPHCHTHTCMYVHVHTCTYVHTHTHTHTHTCMFLWTVMRAGLL